MGQLCSIKSGKSDTKDAVADGPYDFFDRSRTVKRSTRYLHDCEALIIPGEGTEFLPRHYSGKFDLHQRAYALFNFSNLIDVRYLYHYLHYKRDYFPQVAVGATVKSLRLRHFEQLPVPIAPLPEQRRIVAILDEAFEGIATAKANAEKNLQNAREVFESHLNAVFSQRGEGWVGKRLGDVCSISSNLVDPRKDEMLDLIHIGAGNIESKTGQLTDLKTAGEEGLISGKFNFDSSMVLYSKIRPYLVKVVRPAFSGLCSADIYPLLPASTIIRDYLYYLLLTKDFTDYAVHGSARAGMPKVNRDHLFLYKISIPTVSKQKIYTEQLDGLHEETKRLESLYQQKLTALDELKQSLLHQAFNGYL
ncbi:restriction endonuclease subunit S [Acidithiobacillus ferriphilus]|uniref:restriction endonuclease subunit S n=1 Tax=Acidithiobacillus ferriphilus TaxID=1689834 RepID=UPI001C066692|nr:restriction endonuclease subunit S [Acidithiobacillus ferriphilus]